MKICPDCNQPHNHTGAKCPNCNGEDYTLEQALSVAVLYMEFAAEESHSVKYSRELIDQAQLIKRHIKDISAGRVVQVVRANGKNYIINGR